MARFLSPDWFAEVQRDAGQDPPAVGALVVEQVVHDTPDGPVTYRVEVAGRSARLVWPVPGGAPAPDLRISCDWATAVDIAQGSLSAQRALMQGRLRVSGHPGSFGEAATGWAGIDPVPARVREATTYAGGT